jgi:outer membrane protein OmpA-like peptidoglycan-associated protein
MPLRSLFLSAVCFLSIASTHAFAQSSLTEGQILNSLAGTGQAAQAAGFDIIAIRADIEQRIRVEGTENAASPPPALQALATLPNLTVEIQFDFDSDRILPRSYHTVGRIADALHHPVLLGYKFAVIGHTDAKGSRDYNLKLSERRAIAVVEALTTTFQVDASQLVALGLGEEQPQDIGNPEAALNRRVQLLNIGPR